METSLSKEAIEKLRKLFSGIGNNESKLDIYSLYIIKMLKNKMEAKA